MWQLSLVISIVGISAITVLPINAAELSSTDLVITAFQSLGEVYVDGVRVMLSNDENWTLTDRIPLPPMSQLIALEGLVVLDPTCAGVLASINDTYLVTNNLWKCSPYNDFNWEQPGFDDSSWPSAVEYGSNGNHLTCTEQIQFTDISSSAQWIWTDDPDAFIVFCRGYLQTMTSVQTTEGITTANRQTTQETTVAITTHGVTTDNLQTTYRPTTEAAAATTTVTTATTAIAETTLISTADTTSTAPRTTAAISIAETTSINTIGVTSTIPSTTTTPSIAETTSINTIGVTSTIPSTTTTTSIAETTSVNTIGVTSTIPSTTTTPSIAETTSINTIGVTSTIPSTTTTTSIAETTSVNTIGVTSTIPSTTTTTSIAETTSINTIGVTSTIPSTTTTPSIAETTSSNTTGVTSTIPSTTTTTYIAETTSSNTTGVTSTIPSTTATTSIAETTSSNTIGVTSTIPSTTATTSIAETTSSNTIGVTSTIPSTTATTSIAETTSSNTTGVSSTVKLSSTTTTTELTLSTNPCDLVRPDPPPLPICKTDDYCNGPFEKPGASIVDCACPADFLNVNNNCCMSQNWIIGLTCLCVAILLLIFIIIIVCICHSDSSNSSIGDSVSLVETDRLSDDGHSVDVSIVSETKIENHRKSEGGVVDARGLKEDALHATVGGHLASAGHGVNTLRGLQPSGLHPLTQQPIYTLGRRRSQPAYRSMIERGRREDYFYNPLMVEMLSNDIYRHFRPNMSAINTNTDYSIQRPEIELEFLYNQLYGSEDADLHRGLYDYNSPWSMNVRL